MKISFLITHYNRPDDLFECISSIRKLEIANSEIIVSDDASKKECIEIIQQFKVDQLLLSNSNEGLAANINRGIKACSGEYIIYCQEDFVLDSRVSFLINDFIELLNDNKVDMIRFTSNILFNKRIPITKNVVLIPKFSFHNFLQNYYQYSDHPFITKKSFYEKYGYYLEGTSGRYGETEYGIRILKSNAKIAMSNIKLASDVFGSKSVLMNESNHIAKVYKLNKKWIKIARAFRLYFELIVYNSKKRGLITYKNFRN